MLKRRERGGIIQKMIEKKSGEKKLERERENERN
jgi:hypothetical protein